MSEQTPITHADLARYWGCSPANVSNLVKRKGMPPFTTLRQADEWRAVNAPLRKQRQSEVKPPPLSEKIRAEGAKKTAGFSSTTTPPATPKEGAGALELPGLGEPSTPSPKPPVQRINVAQFVDPNADFITLQIRNAEELSQITFGLLRLKTEEGEPGAIAAAAKNWHETSKAAADVIEKFVAIQREAGALIPIDAVEDVIATELEEIRRGLKRLGKRAGPLANPSDPALAERAIDFAVDQLLAAFNNLVDRAKLELAEDKDEAEPAAVLETTAAP